MLAVISILVLFLQPLVLKQETFLAFRPQQEKGSVEVITADVATTNGVHSVNSRTELSANPVTPQPTQTMVMTVPAKNKSDSSIADVLVNEYASNGDKQSKNSYGSEASVTGKKVDVFSFGNIQMLTIVFSEHLRGFMGLSRVSPNIYKSSQISLCLTLKSEISLSLGRRRSGYEIRYFLVFFQSFVLRHLVTAPI